MGNNLDEWLVKDTPTKYQMPNYIDFAKHIQSAYKQLNWDGKSLDIS